MTVNRAAGPDRADASQHSPGATRNTADRVRSAASWLASAHPHPAEVHQAWEPPHGMAALPCGVLFTAVRLPAPIVYAALGTDNLDTVHARLGERLGGPVICDPARARYYPLVPVHTVKSWQNGMPYVRCPEPERRLGTPAPTATQPSEQTPYRAVPPQEPGHLCDPAAAKDLTRHGQWQAAVSGAGWCHWHKDYAPDIWLIQVTGTTGMDAGGRCACRPCRRAHHLTPFYAQRT